MRQVSLKKIFEGLQEKDNFVFLETKRVIGPDCRSYLFSEPAEVIYCTNFREVKKSLEAVEKFLKKGYFAAGYICYEAGCAFEDNLPYRDYGFMPVLWFGIYKKPALILDHRKEIFDDDVTTGNYSISSLKPGVTEKEYTAAINKIKHYIEKGDTYQVNYTFKLKFDFTGSVFDLYAQLREKQSVSYSGIIKSTGKYILSFSPELFFRREGRSILVKPMKGTAERGRYAGEDEKNRVQLSLCAKNRSENVMIVDLLRNDIGKVSETSSVLTTRLFEVERYESLFQMTSTVKGKIQKKVSLCGLLGSIFPSGSVTGAPKIRTMQIINELEKESRMIYTGSIGFFSPCNKAVFNVAIRTLLIDEQSGKGEMGIGSGIVYDSVPEAEYAECILKSDFLTKAAKRFDLIETILWEPVKGYTLLSFHLQRLAESSSFFRFAYEEKNVVRKLYRESRKFAPDKKYRVRLLLKKNGNVSIEHKPLIENGNEKQIAVSDKKVSSSNVFLFHKTTCRDLYDKEYKKFKDRGYFDVVFLNEKNELTEGAISNLFIRKNGVYYTPPLDCGLLNGVYRRYLLSLPGFPAKEKILYRRDIETADEIYLTNAVRGINKVNI